eukprot:TRINITY_DN5334_c1_g1_i2.p1 TRINITY_DN5334_c1_g1~~TRINITY_DN5334_c1_g1_i2.p1  ORF type:complete len:255 (+),score=17.81 TRINITY_DN5334_c1_g1_i2:45-767(+)
MRCSLAPKDIVLEAGWVTDWSKDDGDADLPLNTMSRLVDPIDFNTEAKILETLSAWCDKQLAGYATALQTDLSDLDDETTPWLRQQVLRALIAEKQTIVGLQKELRGKMQQLKEGCPLETLYEQTTLQSCGLGAGAFILRELPDVHEIGLNGRCRSIGLVTVCAEFQAGIVGRKLAIAMGVNACLLECRLHNVLLYSNWFFLPVRCRLTRFQCAQPFSTTSLLRHAHIERLLRVFTFVEQ